MNKLTVILTTIIFTSCAGTQQKLADAKSKVHDIYPRIECRAKIISPYLDFILAEDLPALLDGLKDIDYALEVAGVVSQEAKDIKAAFAACGKL